MRNLIATIILFAVCGTLQAQKPIVTTKCDSCLNQKNLQFGYYKATITESGEIIGEHLMNETQTESYYFDYIKNECIDAKGHIYVIAYDMSSDKTRLKMYVDGKTIEIFTTSTGNYTGHTIEVWQKKSR